MQGDVDMGLKERVYKRMQKLGFNQKVLADKSGLTQATISRILSGTVRQLKSGALTKLASALQVTTDFLLERVGENDPKDMIKFDDRAQNMLRGYENLDEEKKLALEKFLKYLESEE